MSLAPITQLAAKANGPRSDAELVACAKDGERAAQAALFRRHATSIHRTISRISGRREETEDIVQEAFAIALEKLPTLEDHSAFKPWVLRIAINRLRRFHRRRLFLQIVGRPVEEIDLPLESLISPDISPERAAELTWVARRVERLPAKQRIAWTLRFVDGLQIAEVAAAMEVSVASVKRYVRSAVGALDRRTR